MSKRDYYETLGVSKNASDSELKSAYRKMAMKYHPDQNQDNPKAEEKFKEVNEAWEVLKDPQKKGAYDQYGHSAFENGQGGGAGGGFGGGFGGFGGGGGFGDFNDIFGDFFGGRSGGGNRGPQPGNDLKYSVNITLEEAFNGTQTDLSIATAKECKPCGGSGAENGSSRTTCGTCGGQGAVRMQQGPFTVEQPCPHCDGEGQIIEKKCSSCSGQGRTNGTKNLSANIPAGVDEGTRIRLSGEGEAGMRGAANGDLYLFVSVAPHDIFNRDGHNITMELPIPLTTACLGGLVEVPTIDGGRVEINIPEGTQTETRFRIRGRGMSILQSDNRGDMYVKVNVETPTKLSKKQKQHLQDLQESLDEQNTPNSSGVIDKIKSFWDKI